jgi:hypothetical protein
MCRGDSDFFTIDAIKAILDGEVKSFETFCREYFVREGG